MLIFLFASTKEFSKVRYRISAGYFVTQEVGGNAEKIWAYRSVCKKKKRKSKLMVWGNNIYFVSNDKTA